MRKYGKPANWDHWSNMLSVRLWQAVALSLDFEPESVADFEKTFGGLNDRYSQPDFVQRLEIATNHLTEGRLKIAEQYAGYPIHWEVRLGDYHSWAVGMGWKLPDAFPHKIDDSPPVLNTAETPNRKIKQRPPKYEAQAWAIEYYQEQQKLVESGEPPPTRDDDEAAFKARFPTAPVRMSRELRTQHAPEKWQEQGRRRKSKIN